MRWKVIAKKIRWGKPNKESTFLKKTTFLFPNSVKSNIHHSSSKGLLFVSYFTLTAYSFLVKKKPMKVLKDDNLKKIYHLKIKS